MNTTRTRLPRPARCSAIALVLALLASTGCSLGVRSVPRSHKPGEPTDCTDDYALPLLDLLAASGAGAVAVAAMADDCEADGFGAGICRDVNNTAATIGIAIATGFVISSLRGATRVAQCRRARRSYEERNPYALSPPGVTDPTSLGDATWHSARCRHWRQRVYAAERPEDKRQILRIMPPECI